MILNKFQFDGVNAIGREFYGHSMVSLRLAVAAGVRVFFTPSTIRIEGPDNAVEMYNLMQDFQSAYSSL